VPEQKEETILEQATRLGSVPANQIRLGVESGQEGSKAEFSVDHTFKRNVTIRAYVQAILSGKKVAPTTGVELTWKPGR